MGGVFPENFLAHFVVERQFFVKLDCIVPVYTRMGAGEENFVTDDGVGGFHIEIGMWEGLVFGKFHKDVLVAEDNADGFGNEWPAAVTDDNFQSRKEISDMIDIAWCAMFNDGALDEAGWAAGDDNRNVQRCAGFVNRQIFCVIGWDSGVHRIKCDAAESLLTHTGVDFLDG